MLPALLVRPAQGASIAVVVPADGLHLRAGPSTDAKALDLIPSGTRIAITGAPTADGWHPAAFRNQRGYVMGSFLAFDDLTAAAARPATVSSNDGLNLRAAPSDSADLIMVIPAGAQVTATGQATTDGWALVQIAEKSGWVSATYLSFDSSSVLTTQSAASSAPATASANATRVLVRYYHPSFEGGRLSCGGTYHADDATIAATNSWPCGTTLRICREAACIAVTVRDRGGMGANEIDLSASGFAKLASLNTGVLNATAEVMP